MKLVSAFLHKTAYVPMVLETLLSLLMHEDVQRCTCIFRLLHALSPEPDKRETFLSDLLNSLMAQEVFFCEALSCPKYLTAIVIWEKLPEKGLRNNGT